MASKIMILEDDEATAELIKFYLKEEGFQVSISSKGEGFVDIDNPRHYAAGHGWI